MSENLTLICTNCHGVFDDWASDTCHNCKKPTQECECKDYDEPCSKCGTDGELLYSSDFFAGLEQDSYLQLSEELIAEYENYLKGEIESREIAELKAENEHLHTWQGLMEILNEHYPSDVFLDRETAETNFKTAENIGAVVVNLIRRLNSEKAENERLKLQIKALAENDHWLAMSNSYVNAVYGKAMIEGENFGLKNEVTELNKINETYLTCIQETLKVLGYDPSDLVDYVTDIIPEIERLKKELEK